MKTQNTLQISELPALIASILMDDQLQYHYLFKRFMDEANKAYLLLVQHGSTASMSESDYQEFKLLRSRLGGYETAVMCLSMDDIVSHYINDAFQLVLDILYGDFNDSAWFANLSPDFAALENVAVEVTQGTTYFLCSNKNYCICDFGTQDEPRTCHPCFVNPPFNPVIQCTDSFFDSLSLSFYDTDLAVFNGGV